MNVFDAASSGRWQSGNPESLPTHVLYNSVALIQIHQISPTSRLSANVIEQDRRISLEILLSLKLAATRRERRFLYKDTEIKDIAWCSLTKRQI